MAGELTMTSNVANVTQDATQAIQAVSEKTAQSVIQHSAQYSEAYSAIDSIVESFWQRTPYLIIAVIVLVVFWVLSKLFKLFIAKTLSNRSYTRQNLVLVLNRVGSTFIIFMGILIALVIAVPGFTPGQLLSALGVSSIAIGFAFKDIFQNMLSGILILLGEPFRIGDTIVVNNMEGTVEDIQVRATFLRSADGRRLVIPNATVYTSAITVNTAYSHRRCDFSVGIGYEDDVQHAKSVILNILDRDQTILSQPGFSVNVSQLGDFSVKLSVTWWINTQETSTSASISQTQEAVVRAFHAADISIPYPVQEVKIYRGEQLDKRSSDTTPNTTSNP